MVSKNKSVLLSVLPLDHFKEFVEWRFFTQQRETLLIEMQNISWKSFLQSMSGDED
jgi:hypothetical protein